jgi:hypothetical protein
MSEDRRRSTEIKLQENPNLSTLEQARIVAKAYIDSVDADPIKQAQREVRERAQAEINARHAQEMNKLGLEREAQQELERRDAEDRKQRAKDAASQRRGAKAARIAIHPMAVQHAAVLERIAQLQEELEQLKFVACEWYDILEHYDDLLNNEWYSEHFAAAMSPTWPTDIDAVSAELDKRDAVLLRLSSPEQPCDAITADELEQWFTSEHPRRLVYKRDGCARYITKTKRDDRWCCAAGDYARLYATTCEKSAKQCILRHKQFLEEQWALAY